MTDKEIDLLAKCCWKENRRGGLPGMTSIINVIQNRAVRRGKTIEQIILTPWQFTSMSVESDPEYAIDPSKSISADLLAWGNAQELAEQANAEVLPDITHGATLYYAPKGIKTTKTIMLPNGENVPFPQTWNTKAVRYACTICDQHFFVEL